MIEGHVLASFASLFIHRAVCSAGLTALPVTRWASIACTFVILDMKILEHDGSVKRKFNSKNPDSLAPLCIEKHHVNPNLKPNTKETNSSYKKWAWFRK